MIKYETVIDELLRELLFDSWMDEEDYNAVVEDTLKSLYITKQTLSDEIEIGVNNGYSVEQQIMAMRIVLCTGCISRFNKDS